ncbi:hypothetical protein EP331_02330 [bacterium]|nr:MAG: hypothetical protein EP331_02330 [bacterium]
MQRNLVILILAFLFLPINLCAQVGAMDFYNVTRSGSDKVSITKMEYAWLSILYQEKKMNNWYEKFWVNEGFTSPEDMYVHLEISNLNQEAFVLVFDVSKGVQQADSTFEIHTRIVDMLQGDLQKRIQLDSTAWVQWMAAVNENYNSGEKKSEFLKNMSFRYIVPENGDLSKLKPSKGIGRQQMRVAAKDLAYLYLNPAIDDLHLVYKDFLKISGFELYQDAEIILERNKGDDDLLSFVFVMSREVARSDRNLQAHRSMAKQFKSFITRKSEPVKTDWLRFRIEADTTGNIRDRVWLTN